ncbi:hypothetical protein FDA94_09195 [Herbidospora galbida]|uniref:Uncharacterized protein n=1 Tax=Herbidospora galbida TaxID=2575442 RepID=A0A4U3MJH4_9ACTN|nr:hypothetical protein [Herbidospora galbida]TKK89555.1 hypothetical protein FDA94_09195 [Herbidospora galbida]
MSDEVLTTASGLTCDHRGTATPAATHPLTVGATAVVLTQADLLAAGVTACVQVDDSSSAPPTKKCRKVLQLDAGMSTCLTVGGVPVLVTTGFLAVTDGLNKTPSVPPPAPPATPLSARLAAQAGQTVLKGA